MIQLYVTEPMMVRILGKDGARWEEFDPQEFQGDYEPRIQLDVSIQSKRDGDAAQAKEMLAAFLGDPDINQQELKKLVLQRSFELDPDEVEMLIAPQLPLEKPMGEMPIELPPELMGAPAEPPLPPELMGEVLPPELVGL